MLMEKRPSTTAVRTQKGVMDALASGLWILMEANERYELVRFHPQFGRCARLVPVPVVSRMIEKGMLRYEDPDDPENTRLEGGENVVIDTINRHWEMT